MKQTITPRAHAIALLQAIEQQQLTLDDAWARHPQQLAEPDARFARHLVLTTLRHRGQLDALIARHLQKPLTAKNQPVQQALRLGAAQLLVMDIAAHAAVNETVNAIKTTHAGMAPLVNAVLQKLAAERPALPSPGHNLPAWWGTRLDAHYGVGTAKAIAAIAAARPPLDINLPAPSTLPLGERLDAQIWRIRGDSPTVGDLPGYADGTFFVQDIAASTPARLLGDVAGLRILDLCAAPGGKTAQLARARATVTALDRSQHRLARLEENMARLNYQVSVVEADALQWEPAEPFDAILLDAPCSASGTWRRHPEVVHLLTPEKITELATLQQHMLERAWHWLKPGGKLVYCVCSLEPEEGEQQASWFLNAYTDARLATPPDDFPPHALRAGMVRTLPSMLAEKGGMDGFFAACFTKLAG